MAKYHFVAIDKQSSQTHTATYDANNLAELQEAWNEFQTEVPFDYWSSENSADDPSDEELLAELN
jgi:hypothetical protein